MHQPIACTLDARDRAARAGELAALAAATLRTREPTDRGERLRFARGEDTESRLRAAIAAEASCCAFLRMDLRRERDALVLDVTGPPEARPLIAELFA